MGGQCMSRESDDKDLNEWQELEHLVAVSYESMGYKVTRDINLNGHQIDLIASKYITGYGLITLGIEVKYRKTGKVGIQEISKFRSVAEHLRNSSTITTAVMVTNVDYTQDAHGSSYKDGWMQLLRLSDLEQDIFNFSESLVRVKSEYEQSDIFKEYIPLSAHIGKNSYPDIVTLLEGRAKRGETSIVAGDFGSGKTTAVGRLFYNAVCRRLHDAAEPYPILLRLRNFLQYPDVWSFVSDNLRDNQYLLPTRTQFERRLEARQLLVILDGFDEIKTGATAADRAQYISRLTPLLSGGSPCIVTTRPTYFHSIDEMTRLLLAMAPRQVQIRRVSRQKVDVDNILRRMNLTARPLPSNQVLTHAIEMDPLSDQSIYDFVEKFIEVIGAVSAITVREVINFLYEVYDIRDLMRRPLLLKMIIVTIIEGKIDPSKTAEQIGPSTLYDLYTQICAERDLSIRAEGLSVDERLAACRALAMRMHADRTIELSAAVVADVVTGLGLKTVGKLGGEDFPRRLEQALTDIRLCSFLAPGTDGSIRFTHKSFLEFFVAQSFVVERANDYTAFTKFVSVEVTKEILYFLGSFARHEELFRHVIRSSLNKAKNSSSQVWILCRRIALAAPEALSGVTFEGGILEDATWDGAAIENIRFEKCTLRKMEFHRLESRAWSLSECQLNQSKISDVNFVECSLEARMIDVELDCVNFSGGELHFSGPKWAMRETTINVPKCSFAGSAAMIDVSISHCSDLHFKFGLGLLAGSRLKISNSSLSGDANGSWYDINTRIEFKNCHMHGVWLDLMDIISLAEREDSDDSSRILVDNIDGILFSSLGGVEWTPGRQRRFKQRFPNLDVIDHVAISRALQRDRGDYAAGTDIGTGVSRDARRRIEQERQAADNRALEPAKRAIEAHGLVDKMAGMYANICKLLRTDS